MALTCVKATSTLVHVLHRDLPALGRPALGPSKRLPPPARVPATHPLQMQLAELAQSLLAFLRRQLLGRRGPVFRDIRGNLRSQPASGSTSPWPQPGPDTPASPVASTGLASCQARRHPDRTLCEAGGTHLNFSRSRHYSLLSTSGNNNEHFRRPLARGCRPLPFRMASDTSEPPAPFLMRVADAKRGCAQAQPAEEPSWIVEAGRQTQERVT